MQMDSSDGEPEAVRDSLSFRDMSSSAAVGDHDDEDDRDNGSPRKISAADPHNFDENKEELYYGDEDSDDGSFEFAFMMNDPESGPPITADDMFSDGRILPIYPVFDRSLLFFEDDDDDDVAGEVIKGEEGKDENAPVLKQLGELFIEEPVGTNPMSAAASSSSESEWEDVDKLEGIPPETYCIWTPGASPAARSPARGMKSGSTGSMMRWRLRDLMVGRSHSDGKEKFVFLAAPEKKVKEEDKAEEKGKKPTAAVKGKDVKNAKRSGQKVTDVVSAHRAFYGKAGQSSAAGAGRRTYLPYRPDIIGFFAGVNGLSRTYRPL